MALGQVNALDRTQAAYVARKARERDMRVHDLWRWLLTQKMGREFLWDVLLADVGYERPLPVSLDAPTQVALVEQATLRNLGLRWLNGQVRRHRDLYLQMLSEASKREDVERDDEETHRAAWARADQEHDE